MVRVGKPKAWGTRNPDLVCEDKSKAWASCPHFTRASKMSAMTARDIISRINKSHIFKAIDQIKRQGYVPKRRNSTRYSLRYDGRLYPPKYLIALAARFATGKVLTPDDHSGGEYDSNKVLRNLGFRSIARKKSRWSER